MACLSDRRQHRGHLGWCFLGLTLFQPLACHTGNVQVVSEVLVPEGDLDTRDKVVVRQKRGPSVFEKSGVTFSNDFAAGHAFDVRQLDGHTYRLACRAENTPINDSPWYAFQVWAAAPQEIDVLVDYQGGHHRYPPKVSRDGRRFEPLAGERVQISDDGRQMRLRLSVSTEPVWIAAQELVTSERLETWMSGLSRHPFVHRSSIGRSVAGRSIEELEVAEASDLAPVLVVLGRQHPPETTGSLALMAFVDFLCSADPTASRFRRRFRTLIYPMLNPDGVDEGLWRHNLHGVDLNRDWAQFRQPEVRAVRDRLLERVRGEMRFMLDFHSTFEDIFYLLDQRVPVTRPDLSMTWIADLARRLPGFTYKVQRVDTSVPTADVWAAQTFRATGAAYEMGDNTPPERIRAIARAAAASLMELLLKP